MYPWSILIIIADFIIIIICSEGQFRSVLIIILSGGYNDYPHFRDEETEAENV